MDNSNDKAKFIGKVTASVTHEIQNVLAIIKETSGLMGDFLQMGQAEELSDIKEKFDKCINTIKSQTHRGVNLTSRLNGFAHTTDNAMSSVNILESIEKLLSITERLFLQKGIRVVMGANSKPYSTTCDPVLFQMLAFYCLECLSDSFEIPEIILLDIQYVNSLPAIRFSFDDINLKYDDYKKKIIQNVLWTEIYRLCEQMDMDAEIAQDTPGILISFK